MKNAATPIFCLSLPTIIQTLLILTSFFFNIASYGENSVTDYSLYYEIGGNSATDLPASILLNLENIVATQSNSGAICERFNPSVDIGNILSSQLENTLTTLNSVSSSIISALPGSILCRAKPGLCQLLQHYVTRAENFWDISFNSCQEALQNHADGNGLFHDFVQVSKRQTWQEQAKEGNSATEAMQEVSKSDGCVVWVGGIKSGCKGKEPIWLTQDTVAAGWCFLLKKDSNCSATTFNENPENMQNLQNTWSTPKTASDWVKDVIGDHRIQAGEDPTTVIGRGLLPHVENEEKTIQTGLAELVYSGMPPQASDFESLKSNQVRLSPSVIDALRDMPDRDYLISRISNEIALARIVEKAFLARRLLISGLMEPNIQNTASAVATIEKKIDLLEQEIERVTFEMQVKRRLVSDTLLDVLSAHNALTTPIPPIKRKPEWLLQ